jgi:phosphoglycerate dehydrogenase-like enzyme
MGDPSPLIETLDNNPAIQWVQLPWAGVENFLQGGLFDRDARFTSAKGAFATQVAEHAVMQMMVGLRNVVRQARTKSWLECEPESLTGKRVTVLGGGGIASEIV